MYVCRTTIFFFVMSGNLAPLIEVGALDVGKI